MQPTIADTAGLTAVVVAGEGHPPAFVPRPFDVCPGSKSDIGLKHVHDAAARQAIPTKVQLKPLTLRSV